MFGVKLVKPKNYEQKSLPGFVLNSTEYDFSLIKTVNGNLLPHKVHIIFNAGTFTVKLNTAGQTIIDNSTMQSLDDSNENFTGFAKGDTAMLAIGTIKNHQLMTYWLGMINPQ